MQGVLVLLEEAKKHAPNLKRFIQISTDEVYGSIDEGSFTENDPLNPRNPYSASKAGGDRMAYAYAQTYGMPVIVTRASNNYGPFQYPEKLIPLFVTNAIDDQPLPLYGDGKNVRDWLFVEDHCAAVDFLIEHGTNSETYNIGGGNERENREITHRILQLLGKPESLIKRVADRVGHDRRYSVDTSKLEKPRLQDDHRLRRSARAHRAVVRRQRAVVARHQGTQRGVQGVLREAVRESVTARRRALAVGM